MGFCGYCLATLTAFVLGAFVIVKQILGYDDEVFSR